MAELLGEDAHISLLDQTLGEEKKTDETLTELSAEINPQAAQGSEAAEDDSEEEEGSKSRRTSARKGNSRRAA